MESNFSLNAKIIIDAINTILPSANKIDDLASLTPETLFKDKIDGRQKRNVASKVYTTIAKENKRKFVIITKENKNFETLSPGWKTAVLLDLILGYSEDNAPIFIDQPEDNIDNETIYNKLTKWFRELKLKRQVIVVTHDANIVVNADAENVIIATKESDDSFSYDYGALEYDEILNRISIILDGGVKAVERRLKKYGREDN